MLRVSIVINNYNYEQYLALAIDSALKQSYADVEVLVVDDGSTDSSKQIIDSYGARICAIYKQNGGQASAFNAGIEAASGDYILLLDADDVLLPKAVETALGLMEPGVVRLAYGLMEVDEHGEHLGLFHQNAPKYFHGSLRDAVTEANFMETTPTSGNLFRARELKQCLPFPEEKFRISADIFLWFAIAKHGDLKRVPAVLGQYRLHGANNYAQSGSRNLMCPKKLRSSIQGLLNISEMALEFSSSLPSADQKRFTGFFMQMHQILAISDARMRMIDEDRLLAYTRGRLVQMGLKAFMRRFRFGELPGRVYRFALILANEFLPLSVNKLVYHVLSRAFPTRFSALTF